MSVMSNSYSLDGLADDPNQVEADLATHPEGIVAVLRGNDVARIVPLSPEERAWREALRGEGQDPNSQTFSDPNQDEYLPIHAEVERSIYGDRDAEVADLQPHSDNDAQTHTESELDTETGTERNGDEDMHVESSPSTSGESLPESLEIPLAEPDEDSFPPVQPDPDRDVEPTASSDPKPDEDREVESDWDESWLDSQED